MICICLSSNNPNVLLPTLQMEILVNYCSVTCLENIIRRDSNSRDEIWRSSSTNNRCEAIVDYLSTTDIMVGKVENVGDSPTFVNILRKVVLDITDCSASVAGRIIEWRVLEEVSDHRLVRFLLKG